MVRRFKKKVTMKKLILIILVSVAMLLAILFILEKKQIINLYSRPIEPTSEEAKTTSQAPTAQSDFIEGGEREPGNNIQENRGDISISDNNGNVSPSTNTSNPLTSASGEISVYNPLPNLLFATGQEISGKSKLAKVSYRIIDSVSGVLTTGELTVVNGTFSGLVNFNTNAQEGRIDIYGMKADGVEFSNVEIPVIFR